MNECEMGCAANARVVWVRCAVCRWSSMGWLVLVVLAVLNAGLARAEGIRYDDIPGVGSTATWEVPGTRAFLKRIDRLAAFRANELPILRSNLRFIAQSDDGNEFGGGGDGLSPATPWRCRDMTDVSLLLASRVATGTSYLFRKGDTFYARRGGDIQGVAVRVPSVTIGAYEDPARPSNLRPRLLGFAKPVGLGAWRQIGPGVFERDEPAAVHWVRARRADADAVTGFRETPYYRARSLDDVAFVTHSFFYGPGVLRVNVGVNASEGDVAHDLASLEECVASGYGVFIDEAHDVRVDSLVIEGFGVDLPQGGFTCVRISASGNKTVLISNCDWGWSAYHGMLHLASLGSGGIVTLADCTFGYHANRTTEFGGGGDGAVSFALRGDNEFIAVRCASFGGGLRRMGEPGADASALGMPLYMHTGGNHPIRLHVRVGCTFVPAHPTRARYVAYAAGNETVVDAAGNLASEPALLRDPRFYRAFIVDERADTDGGPVGSVWRCIDVNTRIVTRIGPGGGNRYVFGVGTSTHVGLSINRDHEVRIDPNFTGYLFMAETSQPHRHEWHFARLWLTGGQRVRQQFFATEVRAARLLSCALFNCVLANQTPDLRPTWNYPALDPREPANSGGVYSSAFFAFPTGWLGAPECFELRAIPVYESSEEGRNQLPDELRDRAGDTSPLEVEHDVTRAVRPRERSTIGPLEGNAITCPADFDRSRTVDFFDYLEFVRAFSVESWDADVNEDGQVDAFDYLDFVSALDLRC
ncbi:MAG: hypothetical protein SFZ23_14395 [Planctomycetota bacterium]|nr:hypothetical protein [Planctomycetota bacterium]